MPSFIIKENIQGKSRPESMQLGSKSLKGTFICYAGKQGDYLMDIIPSINISGYGHSEDSAMASLKENLKFFISSLFHLSTIERATELEKLGWKPNRLFKKKFSKSFLDENFALRGFDHPERFKKYVLEVL